MGKVTRALVTPPVDPMRTHPSVVGEGATAPWTMEGITSDGRLKSWIWIFDSGRVCAVCVVSVWSLEKKRAVEMVTERDDVLLQFFC